MNMIKNLLSILILGLCLLSCNKDSHCPRFLEELETFVPYELNDTIRFDTGCDTIEFVIFYYEKHDEEIIPRNCDCGCTSFIYVIASYKDISLRYSYTIESLGKQKDHFFHLSIEYGINRALEADIQYEDRNETYEECVILLENNINRAIVAKNYGIVRIIFKNGEVWTLIEE